MINNFYGIVPNSLDTAGFYMESAGTWQTRDTWETHRQAAQNGCLPSLLVDGDKGIEIVYIEEKNILYWADKHNEPTKEGPNFHLYSLSHHLPQFQQSAGATPLYPLWGKQREDIGMCKSKKNMQIINDDLSLLFCL